MTHEEAFLIDICEQPDDDSARLIFADWLEDQGEATRAQFIRAQCRLAQMAWDDPERLLLENEERALAQDMNLTLDAAATGSWAKRLPVWMRSCSMRFARGFVAHLECTVAQLAKDVKRVFATTPLQSLSIKRQPNELIEKDIAPYLPRLRSLDLAESKTNFSSFEEVLSAGGFSQLHQLALEELRLGPDLAKVITNHSHLQTLRSLNIAGNRIDAQALQKICTSLNNLRSLNVSKNNMRNEATRVLADAPPTLEVLDLGNNGLSDAAVIDLLESEALPQLRDLNLLGNNKLTPKLWSAKPSPVRIGRLHLRVGHTPLTALAGFHDSPLAAGCSKLTLTFALSSLSLETVRNLFECPNLDELTSLAVLYAQWEEGVFGEFLQSQVVSNLRELDLTMTYLELSEVGLLVESEAVEHLQRLSVSHHRLDAKSLAKLRERFGSRLWIL
jgi:uncharacterized protein (TIGR02996 family)